MNDYLNVSNLVVHLRDRHVVRNVSFNLGQGQIGCLLGPSGCGKTTTLRTIAGFEQPAEGEISLENTLICSARIHKPPEARHIGMVFQRPNPLPLSVQDNVLFGHRLHRTASCSRADEDAIVEQALRQVLLWDRVKDRLNKKATQLSLEEQQKLCIARLLPTKPQVLLMDEPCSALDPEATSAVEELIWELRGKYSILIVTHNMAQARRASDECVFMLLGKVIEHTATEQMFVAPEKKETSDYIEGRFG